MFKGQSGRFKLTGLILILVIVLRIYATIYAYSDKESQSDSALTYSEYMSMDYMLKESYLDYMEKSQVKDNEELEDPQEGKAIGEKDKEVIDEETSSQNPPINEEEKKPAQSKANGGKNRVVAYYSSWSAYTGFTPDKIDASKLTHINYAFANIGKDLKIIMGDSQIDPSNFKMMNNLKNKNKDLKILISVGGWTWSDKFSDVALTENSRAIFANSVVDFLLKYNLDGVDLDWEYPVSGGLAKNSNRPEDKKNFTLLLKTIREKLNEQGSKDGKYYLLTFSGGTSKSYVNNIELNKIKEYVDFANVMTYDVHGDWDKYTDFNAPLYDISSESPHHKWSVNSAVNLWLNAGFPGDKLNLGIPFYGYRYENVANTNKGFLQGYSSGKSISYKEIVDLFNTSNYTRHYNSEAKVPWAYNGSTFISYDDEESIAAKMEYIRNKGLGGAMIWEMSQDHNGVLLNSVHKGIR